MTGTYFRIALTAAALAAALLVQPARAADIVVPSAQAAADGSTQSSSPFGSFFGPMRYQQVHAASDFPAGPHLITQIKLRANKDVGSFGPTTIAELRIDLSTTSAAPDLMSYAFADNVGADNTTVFGGPTGASLTLDSNITTSSAPGPQPFDIVITLAAPFPYDPSQGHLLMDVYSFSAGGVGSLDAEGTLGDSVGAINSLFFGVESPDADPITDTSVGLVVSFTTASTDVDSDGDGVLDSVDVVPNSDMRLKVDVNLAEAGETSVDNLVDSEGRTIQDVVNELAANAASHEEYVTGIKALADALYADGVITKDQRKELGLGAARSNIGK